MRIPVLIAFAALIVSADCGMDNVEKNENQNPYNIQTSDGARLQAVDVGDGMRLSRNGSIGFTYGTEKGNEGIFTADGCHMDR